MTSVTEIVDMISSMMVAFVSISLVVSSIMIGVITYISVLERRKEIGILRAIGASKRNVSEVFNAETFIIGLCSGVMGIVLSEILLIPGNIIIQKVSGTSTSLPPCPWMQPSSSWHWLPCSPFWPASSRPAAQQVQPRQSPARRVNPKNFHSRYPFRSGGRDTGIFSAYFCSGPSVQLVSILHENALFCSKSYKRVRSSREILTRTGNHRKSICFSLCGQINLHKGGSICYAILPKVFQGY